MERGETHQFILLTNMNTIVVYSYTVLPENLAGNYSWQFCGQTSNRKIIFCQNFFLAYYNNIIHIMTILYLATKLKSANISSHMISGQTACQIYRPPIFLALHFCMLWHKHAVINSRSHYLTVHQDGATLLRPRACVVD